MGISFVMCSIRTISLKEYDPLEMEHQMWKLLDARRAEYPAEHNVGHLYIAKPALANFYQKLDPTNSFNVGIGIPQN